MKRNFMFIFLLFFFMFTHNVSLWGEVGGKSYSNEEAIAAISASREGKVIEDKIDGFVFNTYIPRNYNKLKKYPLIVGSHGGGGQTGYEVINAWKTAADKRGYIVVAPTFPKSTDWNKMSMEKVFIDIVETTKSRYNIDGAKVLMTGNSAGAGDTYFVGLSHPEVFSAIAPCCGRMEFLKGFPWKKGLKKIPVYILHGEKDVMHLPENAYQAKELLEKYGYTVKLRINKGLGHIYPVMLETPIPDWIDHNFK